MIDSDASMHMVTLQFTTLEASDVKQQTNIYEQVWL